MDLSWWWHREKVNIWRMSGSIAETRQVLRHNTYLLLLDAPKVRLNESGRCRALARTYTLATLLKMDWDSRWSAAAFPCHWQTRIYLVSLTNLGLMLKWQRSCTLLLPLAAPLSLFPLSFTPEKTLASAKCVPLSSTIQWSVFQSDCCWGSQQVHYCMLPVPVR